MTTDAMRSSAVGHLDQRYVDWASIIAGALIAVAIFTTLMIFGSAIGLSLTSSDPAQGLSGKVTAIAVGLWTAWIAASSFAAGGYIAGRLRHRIAEATNDEVRMRDGVHGLVSWAIATLMSGVILAGSIGASASTVALDSAATALNSQVVQLFRGAKIPEAGTVKADAAALLKTIAGHATLNDSERSTLNQLVVERTGLSAAEANTRVGAAVDAIHSGVDQARRASVVAAFLAAAALAIGAAAAWSSAITGGKNRDESVHLSPMTRWYL